MGIILSRFRKKRTTIEILEDLDSKIKEIEQYGQSTEQRHKKIVGTLVICSVVLYIMTALIFYFYFFPASLYDQIFYITPLLIFPILILLTKKMVSWYYKRKISRNQDKLTSMQHEKKKILDEVTETETYKKAKEILLKFAPDQLRMSPLTPQPAFKISAASPPLQHSTPQAALSSGTGTGELRRRVLTSSNQTSNLHGSKVVNVSALPVGIIPTQYSRPSSPSMGGNRTFAAANYRSPLPRPILPNQRSYLDRLVDYLVGDGPSNRYALICRQCESHNGMALKEEFEYFGFRCCYCNFWNPARKQKPFAPKIDFDILQTPPSATIEHASGNANLETMKFTEIDTSSQSDTDSDIEVVERPTELSKIPENTLEQGSAKDENAIEGKEPSELDKQQQDQNNEDSHEPMEIDEDSEK